MPKLTQLRHQLGAHTGLTEDGQVLTGVLPGTTSTLAQQGRDVSQRKQGIWHPVRRKKPEVLPLATTARPTLYPFTWQVSSAQTLLGLVVSHQMIEVHGVWLNFDVEFRFGGDYAYFTDAFDFSGFPRGSSIELPDSFTNPLTSTSNLITGIGYYLSPHPADIETDRIGVFNTYTNLTEANPYDFYVHYGTTYVFAVKQGQLPTPYDETFTAVVTGQTMDVVFSSANLTVSFNFDFGVRLSDIFWNYQIGLSYIGLGVGNTIFDLNNRDFATSAPYLYESFDIPSNTYTGNSDPFVMWQMAKKKRLYA